MPTPFNVNFLGISGIDIDPTEGIMTPKDMGLPVGSTFGAQGSPLYGNIRTLSPLGSPGATYDPNNYPDQFSVNGTTYRFDGGGGMDRRFGPARLRVGKVETPRLCASLALKTSQFRS